MNHQIHAIKGHFKGFLSTPPINPTPTRWVFFAGVKFYISPATVLGLRLSGCPLSDAELSLKSYMSTSRQGVGTRLTCPAVLISCLPLALVGLIHDAEGDTLMTCWHCGCSMTRSANVPALVILSQNPEAAKLHPHQLPLVWDMPGPQTAEAGFPA